MVVGFIINKCEEANKILFETKDFLNMEFAFKYGIWEFLIHDLTSETQHLAAIGYGIDLNFLCIRDQLHIIFRDRSGSVVECLTQDRGDIGSSLTGATAFCL